MTDQDRPAELLNTLEVRQLVARAGGFLWSVPKIPYAFHGGPPDRKGLFPKASRAV